MIPFAAESEAVHRAAAEALEVVQSLSNELSANDNADAERAQSQLNAARNKLTGAWDALQRAMDEAGPEAIDPGAKTKGDEHNDIDEDRLQVEYMDMITDAFQDVLEDLRLKQGDDLDVDALVDCLQSGLDLFSQQDKAWFLETHVQPTTNADDRNEELTPHEKRRRALGFAVEESHG